MAPTLEVERLSVRYGAIAALRGVSLEVAEGELVAVLGPNGAGKSTLLLAIAGAVSASGGEIRFAGERCDGRAPERLARDGLALVPERRRIFADLSVEENLRLAALVHGRRRADAEVRRVVERFPILEERRGLPAGQLSGGEQQQLAIARALVTRPRLMLVDEPSLGLAPMMMGVVFELLEELRASGVTILLVEQNVARAAAMADRTYLLRNGEVDFAGDRKELASVDVRALYLGARATNGSESDG